MKKTRTIRRKKTHTTTVIKTSFNYNKMPNLKLKKE